MLAGVVDRTDVASVSIKLSRFLVGLEAGFLLLPVTLVVLPFGIVLTGISFRDGIIDVGIITLLALFSLFSGWVLTLSFILKGLETMKRLGRFWFFPASLGVLITLLSGLLALVDNQSQLTVLVFGSPTLLVFLHLALEGLFRKVTL